MADGRFARPLNATMLSGWVTLRIALLMDITDSGGNLTGTPRFGVGLCSGAVNILGDTTTDNWVGFISNSASWTRATIPSRYESSDSRAATRVGTTLTVAGTDAIGAATWRLLADGSRKLFFVDITRGSPNFTVFCSLFSTSLTGSTDISDAIFVTQSVSGVPAATSHQAATAQTIAVDEGTNGTLDHVNIWYNQVAAPLRIANFRVFRVA